MILKSCSKINEHKTIETSDFYAKMLGQNRIIQAHQHNAAQLNKTLKNLQNYLLKKVHITT